MKYIFDFDDVLFKNTKMLKPRMFRLIAEKTGKTAEEVEKAYQEVRKEFSLVNFIKNSLTPEGLLNEETKYQISMDTDALFKEIMSECHKFLDPELMAEKNLTGRSLPTVAFWNTSISNISMLFPDLKRRRLEKFAKITPAKIFYS